MTDHGRSYLHEDKNTLLLGEGSHFARIGWKNATVKPVEDVLGTA